MSETYPIVEQIAQAIFTRLATVTMANGYAIDLIAQRLLQSELQVKSNLCTIEPIDPTRQGKQAGLGGLAGGDYPFAEWLQPFWVTYYVRVSESSLTPIDQLLQIGRAAIEKCLESADPTWGGLAVRTTFADPQFFLDFKPACVVVVPQVLYMNNRTDPYKQDGS